MFDALLNAAYCVSLRGLGAELEGGGFELQTPSPVRRVGVGHRPGPG